MDKDIEDINSNNTINQFKRRLSYITSIRKEYSALKCVFVHLLGELEEEISVRGE